MCSGAGIGLLRKIGLLCEDPDCTATHVDLATLDLEKPIFTETPLYEPLWLCPICAAPGGFHEEEVHAARPIDPPEKSLPIEAVVPNCRACGEPINRPGEPGCRYPGHPA
jgi:hypothetical protein